MKNLLSFKNAFLILAFTTLAAVGCKDKNVGDAPTIISAGLTGADTTISVGSSITLTPTFASPEGVSYEWMAADNRPLGKNQPLVLTSDNAADVVVNLYATNGGGVTKTYVTVKFKYAGPFYIVNEGSFGKTPGSLTHVITPNNNDTPEITFNAFQNKNAGKTLGNTTCFGTRIGDQYFFVSKQGNRVVSTDLNLLQKGVAEKITDKNLDGRSIVGVSATEGVLATSKGAFKVALTLQGLENANTPLQNTEAKQCGSMLYVKPYVYILTGENKVQIYNADKGLEHVKTIDNAGVGFAQTPDGRIWCALENNLTAIDSKTLTTKVYTLPAEVKLFPSWGAWKPGALLAHPAKNLLYFPVYASAWGGGNQVYKLNVEQEKSLPELLYTGKTDDHFYGAGLGIDPMTANLVMNFCGVSWGDNKNKLVIFNTQTEKEIQRTPYDGYYFPESFLFYNNEK